MKIAITGATGLIGKALSIQLLKSEHEVNALVRDPKHVMFLPQENIFKWDGSAESQDSKEVMVKALKGVDAVVHLAGEPIADHRWTDEMKKKILDSRVKSTEGLREAIRALQPEERPKTFICASAIGYYGDRQDTELDESSASGEGFLAEVTIAWEEAAKSIETLGVRVILLRNSVVLAQEGGALPKMLPAVIGSGKQWMSWIHIDDVIRFVEFALNTQTVRGPYNLSAPHPVVQHEFANVLAEVVKFPLVPKVPEWVLKGALGEMSQVLLISQCVYPQRALKEGFEFKFSQIKDALLNLYPTRNYLDSYIHSAQFVPKERKEVFSFFSKAENLEALTPPWLNFKIVNQSTTTIEKKTKINYKLKIHGVPVKWKTNIDEWEPDSHFVDDQMKGPYSKWHHVHGFSSTKNGTMLTDHVTYRIPGGIVGKLALSGFIKKDVSQIFAYRKKKITELFGA